MRPDFNIGARNGLLDQKHMETMGQSIWLYLWFLDKQPKDSDKVLGGQPITYEMVNESFTGMSRRTYAYWTAQLVKGNYVSLTRTPRGLIVTIEKSKKWAKTAMQKTAHRKKSDVQKVAYQNESDVQDFSSDVQNPAKRYAKIGTSNIRATSSNKEQQLLSPIVDSAPTVDATFKEQVSKLYYEAIKANGLPMVNNNHIRARISEMTKLDDQDMTIKYLIFIRDQYRTIQFDYKPHLDKAIDIADKRVSIINKIELAKKQQAETATVWRAS